jgi:predicted transcriptional regulator
MTDQADQIIATGHTANIVAAYVANNPVTADKLPSLIADVYRAVTGLATPAAEPEPERKPAVPIRSSVQPDFIVCLEDGKKFKSLKRHLRTAYGLTPEAYRERWRLPVDYPMVCPNYSATRSQLAKNTGLGRKGTH